MEKGALLPQIIRVKDESSAAIKITQIITLGVVFTTVMTVMSLCVFFASRHDNIASDAVQPCLGQHDHKLMDKDVRRVSELRKEDGQILSEQFTYDLQSNTAIVHTPGNFSGDAPATLVIEYDQGLVYVQLQDGDSCMVFPLTNDLRKVVNMELLATNGDVVDAAKVTANDNYTMYTVAGEIPDGFVQSYSGPTVGGMCTGRNTYWLELVERSEDRSNLRQKRGCYYVNICWGLFVFSWCN